ncbi:MAG: hypothetical protein L7F77_07585 [Candidatus Magnetominusculus sp. LBB02]|nr:hypothetical protein [Candidatus Magnetominusculus sp. LBB02]
MSNEARYIQDPVTGLFKGSRPGGKKKKTKLAFMKNLKAVLKKKKVKAAAKKQDKPKEVFHGTEFATPDKVEGDINEFHGGKFKETAKILKEHGVKVRKDAVAKYEGDGFFTGDASQYAPTGKPTSKGKEYKEVPESVAINRIFGYQTEPKTRNKYVVVGDMEQDNGKIERRDVTDTGMYGSYVDENDVLQKYPHPTNIVDFHPESLAKFAGKSKCDKRKIMMKTCETPAECEQVKKEMRVRINKWRQEHAPKEAQTQKNK